MASALVLTGIDGPKQVLAADAESRPGFLLGDLRELFEPYPQTEITTSGGGSRYRVGAAVVAHVGSDIRLESRGDSDIDVLRAGTAAVWGAGVPIYALDVDPQLYS